jgi:hypothetical protein
MVLDRCYKLKQADGEDLVEMNFEFIEDTYNYQPKEQEGEALWYARSRVTDVEDYEHISKVLKILCLLSDHSRCLQLKKYSN